MNDTMQKPPKSHISASQWGTYLGCPRKWAYSRVRPRETNEVAEEGTRIHSILESWAKDGKAPDIGTREGRAALAALHLLPPPNTPGTITEHGWTLVVDGIEHLGHIDLLYGYVPGEIVVVCDHKTKGNRRQIMTEDQLLADPQRILYSYWACVTLQLPATIAQWNFIDRAGKWAEAVVVRETREATTAKFRAIFKHVSLPIYEAQGKPPETLPRNTDQCHKYGPRYPCPYIAECLGDIDPIARAKLALA